MELKCGVLGATVLSFTSADCLAQHLLLTLGGVRGGETFGVLMGEGAVAFCVMMGEECLCECVRRCDCTDC